MDETARRGGETPHVWRLRSGERKVGLLSGHEGHGEIVKGESALLRSASQPGSPGPRLRQGTDALQRPEDHQGVGVTEEIIIEMSAIQLGAEAYRPSAANRRVAPVQCQAPHGRPAEGRHGRQTHRRVVRIAGGERAPVVETR